jgi:hypothetical protein
MFWSCCNSLSSNNNPANEEVTVSGSSVEAIDASCLEDAIILASVNSHSDLPLFQGTGVQIYHCGMGTGDRRPPGMGGLQGWVATGMDGQLPWTGGQLTWTRPCFSSAIF